jgi:chemotaxis signal transduction protein
MIEHGTRRIERADAPLITPAQALTNGFKIDTSGDIDLFGQKSDKLDKVSQLVGGDARQGFRIGELQFMIRYEDASELMDIPAIHRLPNAPEWFCGIASLHGKLIPVFDLALYIGVDSDAKARRMLLVLSHGRDATGILIDGLPERMHWSDDEHTNMGAAPEILMPHLRGITLIGERLWFDLDTRSLLNAIEQSLASRQ